ncbi:LPS-assembly protein LptD [Pelagibacterium montanilacus]|uniref:LPS-assembly protein LptD n=1 Tax=Pelagibacterium montanilacus TaxID=2185280 RepID=UPI000F8D4C00|nr:LPS assembly protein LptD [Pelagibacterium montanilacus]
MERSRLGGKLTGIAQALACATGLILLSSTAISAQQILPPGFFTQIPDRAGDNMAVAADAMVFQQANNTVVAQGNVGIAYQGYSVRADRVVYNQDTREVELIGNVALIDPEGVEYVADRVMLDDSFLEGFLQALVVAFPDGSRFTAAEHQFQQGLQRIYTDGSYVPCGDCIGVSGQTIGWKVRAVRVVADEQDNTIYFERPSLEILGVPIASLPWLTLDRDFDLIFPTITYDEQRGVGARFAPFTRQVSGGTVLLTPTLFSRQGLLLEAEWQQRVGDLDYSVTGAGIYQFSPDAYEGLGNTGFRGSLQTSGEFTPTDEWTLGWSGTAFSDPGFMPDYEIASGTQTNELFAEYFTPDTFAEARVQQFVPLDDYDDWAEFEDDRAHLPLTYPNARANHVIELEDGMGRIELSGRLLGLSRSEDHIDDGFLAGVAGDKAQLGFEAGWTNQYIVPGGLAVSPYLGLRGDAVSFSSASSDPNAPASQALFSATPIAAIDIRYPLVGRTTGATTVIEPIAQFVYRGSAEARPGVTNEDSQGFLLDASNVFSRNRFTGWDRQETGLVANVGATVQTSFDNGMWINTVIGQSFHLAGPNAFDVDDGSTATVGTGMDELASYLVAGVDAGWGPHYSLGATLQVDPDTLTVPRAVARADASLAYFDIGADYAFVAADGDLGVSRDRHEIGGRISVPFADYWTATAGLAWDVSANAFLAGNAGVEYDDRFVAFGAQATVTGATHEDPDDLRLSVGFRLRMPDEYDVINQSQSTSEF